MLKDLLVLFIIIYGYVKSEVTLPKNLHLQDMKPKVRIGFEDLNSRLSYLSFDVTQNGNNEEPNTGAQIDFFGKGVYKCIACKEPVFDGKDKFKSNVGFPTFSDNIKDKLVYQEGFDMEERIIEVRCQNCIAYLGRVVESTKLLEKKMFQINSAALMFEAQTDKTQQ